MTLSAAAPGPLSVEYLGETRIAKLDWRTPELQSTGLPPLIRPILPAIRDEIGIAAVPHLGYRRRGVSLLPKLFFRPVKSLSEAGFAVVKPGAVLMS
ncbi:MAG TPA: hypothetical protein VGR45_12905 [Stellaceae bacterium]|nr:hypothetical protein [Stellaceae bacterium]